MCTHLILNNDKDILVSRTMDFSFPLEPEMLVVPRNYNISFESIENLKSHYAFLGLSQQIGSSIFFADGINEYGLSCAALYFDGYASYNEDIKSDKINLAPHEVVSYILANCKNIENAKELFKTINILNSPLDLIGRAAPLHWIIADESGASIVIEPVNKTFNILENILGVVTNSPNLEWHITNLRNYINIEPKQIDSRLLNDFELKPFGQGLGTFGLPGDFTPPSRFVRTVYNKFNTILGENEETLVNSANHILDTVSIPKGSVMTNRGQYDYTQHSCYMALKSRNYYFKTYDNTNLMKVSLSDYNLNSTELIKKDFPKNTIYKNI